jgi:sec-independent protein translocase protein TatC
MDEREAPVTEHLADLRRCIAIIFGTWIVCAIFSFTWAEQIFGFLLAPAVDALKLEGGALQAIAPGEIFFTYLKSALLAGFILDLPVVFWQVWSFIAPGLYANEKKFVIPFVFFSTVLFAGGAIFGYTQVFPLVFQFFDSFSNEFVTSAWTMAEVFKLTTRLFLAFGVAFELPLLVFFLSISGILSAGQLLRATPYAVLIIFVAAAMLTPPDVVSQVLLGLPMIVLYLLGVGVAWIFDPARRRAKREAARAAGAS